MAMPDAWHAALAKPSFNPPISVVAPVWSVLYALIAIAIWRVYPVAGLCAALGLWLTQLVVNTTWSPIFFGLHRIDLALADIIIQLGLLIATTLAFFRLDRVAGYLMLPYLAWVGFATALTFSIWRLNPQ